MIDLASEVTPVDGEDVRIRMPFVVHVGEQVVDLGHQELILAGATLVNRWETGGSVMHAMTTADRIVRWRRHDPSGV